MMASGSVRASILDYRCTSKSLLKAELPFVLLLNFGINANVVPGMVSYGLDAVNIMLVLLNLEKIREAARHFVLMKVLLTSFFAVCLLSAAVNLVSPILTFWELLQVFRFFLYGLLVLALFDKSDAHGVLAWLYRLQWVNAAFVAVEYAVFGLSRDTLGGIFGIEVGCNGPLNAYLGIVTAYAFNVYLAKGRVGLLGLLGTCASALVIASLSELKFFFFEFLVIVVIAVLANRPSGKTIGVIVCSVAALGAGLLVLQGVNPGHFALLVDPSSLLKEANNSNLDTGYGIARLGVFSQIGRTFFGGDMFREMLGFGLGSATMSSVPAFCSPFYLTFGYLKYYYLPSAMLFLQVGYLGVLSFAASSLYPGWKALKERRLLEKEAPGFAGFAACVSVLFIIVCLYENSSRTYFALLWAFALFTPLAAVKSRLAPDRSESEDLS